jgi:hypothetical protein
MRGDIEHVLWLAALQDYRLDGDRAEQLARELAETRTFLRQEASALTFDDEPSTFRVVQALGTVHDG